MEKTAINGLLLLMLLMPLADANSATEGHILHIYGNANMDDRIDDEEIAMEII